MWTKTSEKEPPEYDDVLGWFGLKNVRLCHRFPWGGWITHDGFDTQAPSHWMPLPEPPEGE